MYLANLFRQLEIAFWSTLIPLLGSSNHGENYQHPAGSGRKNFEGSLFLTQALILATAGCLIGLFLGYVAEMF